MHAYKVMNGEAHMNKHTCKNTTIYIYIHTYIHTHTHKYAHTLVRILQTTAWISCSDSSKQAGSKRFIYIHCYHPGDE